jgi:uncharacterized membrane protein HdeD (DUF308 family)
MDYDSTLNIRMLAPRWWVPVARGIAAIVFGILAFTRPGDSLLALLWFFGAYAIVDGAFNLAFAFRGARAGRSWGWMLLAGLVSIAAGVLTFLWPGMTAVALLSMISVWAIILGVVQIAAAIELRRVITSEWMLVVSGVLSIAFGVILIARPFAGVLTLLWMIGGYAIAFGALLIGLGFRIKRLNRTIERTFPSRGTPTPA